MQRTKYATKERETMAWAGQSCWIHLRLLGLDCLGRIICIKNRLFIICLHMHSNYSGPYLGWAWGFVFQVRSRKHQKLCEKFIQRPGAQGVYRVTPTLCVRASLSRRWTSPCAEIRARRAARGWGHHRAADGGGAGLGLVEPLEATVKVPPDDSRPAVEA
jgi:hypothetical protein